MALDTIKHRLVPKHSKVSEAEKEKLFSNYNITSRELPKIFINDPAIAKQSNFKIGDVIKIERESKTAGTTFYYRIVVGA
ncbi:DNA-directed RNA polymerase subunit H [Candidatus Woesearchaeota archaeon]|nr:DNA-directed RNA polymerase subunit H [Candidatus Woesearchaeota archaeon]